MKYSSQFLQLLVLPACLCSRGRANERDFLSPLGLASCWQTTGEPNPVLWGSLQALETKSYDFLPPSKCVVEFIMDGDVFTISSLCLTGLSCHSSHLIDLAACRRQKLFAHEAADSRSAFLGRADLWIVVTVGRGILSQSGVAEDLEFAVVVIAPIPRQGRDLSFKSSLQRVKIGNIIWNYTNSISYC